MRPGRLISTHGLLSPDDPEATYRRKGARPFRGYVTNLTETSEPANPFQLIVEVQTAPNTTEDADLLIEALPGLKARTGVNTLDTDDEEAPINFIYDHHLFCGGDHCAVKEQVRLEARQQEWAGIGTIRSE